MAVFTGNANPDLARRIAEDLKVPLGRATVSRFSDGEVLVEIGENVRGKDTFIIQSTCKPTNRNLMELMIMADAIKRASAERITAVIPYLGYSRQDRRVRSARVPIAAKVIANMLTSVGLNRILTIDLHSEQIQGFFDILVDNVYASPLLIADIWRHKYPSLIVVSPDVGGVVRARAIAKQLDDADLAIIDKRRPKANVAKVMHIIGEVSNRNCVLVDDLVDTAGTLCEAASALKNHGAASVSAYVTHAVLSGDALKKIENSGLDELVVTDTIPLSDEAKQVKQIRQLSVANMLAETIRRIHWQESVSSMYMD
ncbi:MAG: ribose-phosphate pyrophosphokinase [Gammaproteobacteria bacterium]|nr:ribose-phosphate pyrophosphokinase [Gammaproteobacteria bacterium]